MFNLPPVAHPSSSIRVDPIPCPSPPSSSGRGRRGESLPPSLAPFHFPMTTPRTIQHVGTEPSPSVHCGPELALTTQDTRRVVQLPNRIAACVKRSVKDRIESFRSPRARSAPPFCPHRASPDSSQPLNTTQDDMIPPHTSAVHGTAVHDEIIEPAGSTDRHTVQTMATSLLRASTSPIDFPSAQATRIETFPILLSSIASSISAPEETHPSNPDDVTAVTPSTLQFNATVVIPQPVPPVDMLEEGQTSGTLEPDVRSPLVDVRSLDRSHPVRTGSILLTVVSSTRAEIVPSPPSPKMKSVTRRKKAPARKGRKPSKNPKPKPPKKEVAPWEKEREWKESTREERLEYQKAHPPRIFFPVTPEDIDTYATRIAERHITKSVNDVFKANAVFNIVRRARHEDWEKFQAQERLQEDLKQASHTRRNGPSSAEGSPTTRDTATAKEVVSKPVERPKPMPAVGARSEAIDSNSHGTTLAPPSPPIPTSKVLSEGTHGKKRKHDEDAEDAKDSIKTNSKRARVGTTPASTVAERKRPYRGLTHPRPALVQAPRTTSSSRILAVTAAAKSDAPTETKRKRDIEVQLPSKRVKAKHDSSPTESAKADVAAPTTSNTSDKGASTVPDQRPIAFAPLRKARTNKAAVVSKKTDEGVDPDITLAQEPLGQTTSSSSDGDSTMVDSSPSTTKGDLPSESTSPTRGAEGTLPVLAQEDVKPAATTRKPGKRTTKKKAEDSPSVVAKGTRTGLRSAQKARQAAQPYPKTKPSKI